MAFKIPVEDRISTYPGRVVLTPVSGATNTYDLVRADLPIEEGTPLNKELLDNKAYALTEDVTVYVSPTGSNTNGDGTSAAPFATIQAAIDALPKVLDGHTATIDIASGTYNERIKVIGFTGGKLVIGIPGRSSVVVRGVQIEQSAFVETNFSNVTWASGFNGTIFYVGYGSRVLVNSGMTVRCEGSTEVGIGCTYNSSLVIANNLTSTVLNCSRTAVLSTMGSEIMLHTITGSGNTAVGLLAERGSTISYATTNLTSTSGDVTRTGGRIYTAGGASNMATASVE
jgi:hypothetical protein